MIKIISIIWQILDYCSKKIFITLHDIIYSKKIYNIEKNASAFDLLEKLHKLEKKMANGKCINIYINNNFDDICENNYDKFVKFIIKFLGYSNINISHCMTNGVDTLLTQKMLQFLF